MRPSVVVVVEMWVEPPVDGLASEFSVVVAPELDAGGSVGPLDDAVEFGAVVGDSGLGKSRLVQALYQKLAASPEWDPDDFWPDAFGNKGDSLLFNPNFDEGHEAKGPPKFLWLGMRWEDPEGRNRANVACPLPDAKEQLSRHLEVIVKQAGAWGQGKEALRRLVPFATGELSDMGFDEVANLFGELMGAVLPGGGLPIKGVLAVGKAVEGVHGLQGTMAGAEDKAREDAGDQLLKYLRGLMRGGEPMPTVLWLDDAQWVDGATVSFLRKLLLEEKPEGPRKGWPLLVVATHWEREWNEARQAGDSAGKGLAVFEHRSLGGGRSAQVRPLDKSGEGPLGALLDARLPGLTGDQRKLLLGKAAGNFLTMTENIGYLESRKRSFERRDPRGRLTVAGVKNVQEWESERERHVEQRFEKLREEYGEGHQEVLSWGAGSPLGSRFAEEIVVRVAEAEGVDHPRDVLAECAFPLVVLDGGGAGSPPPPLRGFRDRAWFRYAKQFFDEELKDGSEALDGAVREVLSAWVNACFGADGEPADGYGESPLGSKSLKATERVDVLKAAREALPFDADGDWSDGKSAAGLRAACLLVHECAVARLWDRCRRAGEALEGIGWESVPVKVLGQGFRASLARVFHQAGALETAHRLHLHIVKFSRALAAELGGPEGRAGLARSLTDLGVVQRAGGDLDGAAESQREAVGIWRAQAAELGGPEDRAGLARSLNNLGVVQRESGDLGGAAESHREALGIWQALADESGAPEHSQAVTQLKAALEALKKLREGG